MLPKQMEIFNKLCSVSLDMTPKLYCEMYILWTGFLEFQLDLFWHRLNDLDSQEMELGQDRNPFH